MHLVAHRTVGDVPHFLMPNIPQMLVLTAGELMAEYFTLSGGVVGEVQGLFCVSWRHEELHWECPTASAVGTLGSISWGGGGMWKLSLRFKIRVAATVAVRLTVTVTVRCIVPDLRVAVSFPSSLPHASSPGCTTMEVSGSHRLRVHQKLFAPENKDVQGHTLHCFLLRLLMLHVVQRTAPTHKAISLLRFLRQITLLAVQQGPALYSPGVPQCQPHRFLCVTCLLVDVSSGGRWGWGKGKWGWGRRGQSCRWCPTARHCPHGAHSPTSADHAVIPVKSGGCSALPEHRTLGQRVAYGTGSTRHRAAPRPKCLERQRTTDGQNSVNLLDLVALWYNFPNQEPRGAVRPGLWAPHHHHTAHREGLLHFPMPAPQGCTTVEVSGSHPPASNTMCTGEQGAHPGSCRTAAYHPWVPLGDPEPPGTVLHCGGEHRLKFTVPDCV